MHELRLIRAKVVNSIKLFLIISIFALSSCHTNYPSKIIKYKPYEQLSFSNNKKVVLIGGCFDILHYGHINFLKNAKAVGDLLVVALEPDDLIFLSKKRLPIHTQSQRAINLTAIRYVDYVILLPRLNGFKDYNQLVQDVRPNVIAVTSNDPQIHNKKIQAHNAGAKLKLVIDRIEKFATSKILSSN
jgi:cytidyltransferase-like protein